MIASVWNTQGLRRAAYSKAKQERLGKPDDSGERHNVRRRSEAEKEKRLINPASFDNRCSLLKDVLAKASRPTQAETRAHHPFNQARHVCQLVCVRPAVGARVAVHSCNCRRFRPSGIITHLPSKEILMKRKMLILLAGVALGPALILTSMSSLNKARAENGAVVDASLSMSHRLPANAPAAYLAKVKCLTTKATQERTKSATGSDFFILFRAAAGQSITTLSRTRRRSARQPFAVRRGATAVLKKALTRLRTLWTTRTMPACIS